MKKHIKVVLKVEVWAKKALFLNMSTKQKKLNIQTFPKTYTIRKHQRFYLCIMHLGVMGLQKYSVKLGIF